MKRVYVGLLTFMATMMLVVSAASQPPEGKDKKGPPDKKDGPPRGFELGRVLPPFAVDQLDLTEEQQQQIASLEKEVKSKLSRILTDAQKAKLQSMRPKGPPDGKGKDGPPPNGKGKKDLPEKE